MRKVIVFTNLTLDGVMQAPARPDEDRRGGFGYPMGSSDLLLGFDARAMGLDVAEYWPEERKRALSVMTEHG